MLELLNRRRSTRKFKADPVAEKDLQNILKVKSRYDAQKVHRNTW
jgi:hypothetical protein